MDALAIAKAYRKIIARYIVNERSITSALSPGVSIIPVESTRRFSVGERLAIINGSTNQAELATILDIPDRRNIIIDQNLVAPKPAGSIIRKVVGFDNGTEQYIQGIYLGAPPVISHYPAITVNIKDRSSEWMTLESTKETYNLEITVYVQAADWESGYEILHKYANMIENSLFRSFYPLVEPYYEFELQADVDRGDTLVRIEKDALVCGTWVFFESLDYLTYNKLQQNMGGGIYLLNRPIGQDFERGDKMIIPRRHIFNALPATTQYGTTLKGLKAAVISLKCEEEVRRYYPYIDPLTF